MSPESARALIQQLERVDAIGFGSRPPPTPPLPPERGSGSYDPMEPRIAKLEVHMETVQAQLVKLAEVPVQLATLTERVAHLPSKGFVVSAAISTVAGVTGLFVLLQKIGVLH